jgi:alpha-tubulin suppressor-like RCC1 family protein
MKVLRSRRLARLVGCAALVLGAAGTAGAVPAPAQARVTGPVFPPHVVASWGDNLNGQLGDGTTTRRSLYRDIAAGIDVVQVAAVNSQSLAVRSDGTVWAWGANGQGQLGDGTTTGRSTPVRVTGLTGVTQVAAGVQHSVALRSDGTVWAWGANQYGQLGHGTTTAREVTPVQVTGLTGVTKISAGENFSLALRSDGTVWAWGVNQFGQLGNGTTANSAVPVQVAGLSDVTGIAAGGLFAAATRTNGISAVTSVWAWGDNSYGQLGDGTLTRHTIPKQVTGIGTVYIAGLTAGALFAAVLGTDGSVWGWGSDDFGQLGDGSRPPVTRPVNTIGVGSGITQLSAGWTFMLALKSNGTVLAWGDNLVGQLGNGTVSNGLTTGFGPVQVTGLTGATQVAAGGSSAFAVHAVSSLTVPDLSGDTTAQAGQALQAAGLVLGTVTKAVDNYCKHIGTVMSQNPAAGTSASPGSAVSVTIGQNPPKPCP